MCHVHQLPFLKTNSDLEEFSKFCKTSNKALRDWWADKLAWFSAMINEHFSKMSHEDRHTTLFSTNVNESAHVDTNQHTGTNLFLYEAIESACKLDKRVEADTLQSLNSGVLTIKHNSYGKCLLTGLKRSANHIHKNAEYRAAVQNLDEVTQQISEVQAWQKNDAQVLKDLRALAKDIRATSGIKVVWKTASKDKQQALPPNLDDTTLPSDSELPNELYPLVMTASHSQQLGYSISMDSMPSQTPEQEGDTHAPDQGLFNDGDFLSYFMLQTSGAFGGQEGES